MNSNNVTINAFKGLFLNLYFDLRKTIKISSIVVISIGLFDFAMVAIFLGLDEDYSNDASGVLVFGTITMIVAFSVYTVMSTSNEKLREKFSFPINRKIFAISNFLFYIVGSFMLLGVLTMLAPIEVVLYKALAFFSDKFLFLSLVTLDSYLIGLVSGWAMIVAIGSITYCIAIYIRKNIQVSLPVIALIIASVFLFGWASDVIQFVFTEDNLFLFVIKLLGISVLFHSLAYIALQKTEVD